MSVAGGRTIQAGLITTKALTQNQSRRVIEAAAEAGARVCWAIPEHPWSDGDGAEVRVTMTVVAKDPPFARVLEVPQTRYARGEVPIVSDVRVPRLNPDLTAHADVATAARTPLLANAGLCSQGYKPHGTGFLLQQDEAHRILAIEPRASEVLKPYRNGMDLTTRPRNVWIIDFGFLEEAEARQYPVLFDLVRMRVKPERDSNARELYRTLWWRFGEPRREWRAASRGLERYIATVKTAKYRFFTFLDASIAPDDKLTCVASDDPFYLGVLSSAIHQIWALAAGSSHGIAGTPSYDKGNCFDAFPFPSPSLTERQRIGEVAEQLDRHRRAAIERTSATTVTGMYNAIAKVRAGESLSIKEKDLYQIAALPTLVELHAELDRLVAQAYGWSWPEPPALILERLVALHDRRVEEEASGTIRWLRPEYQRSRFGVDVADASAAPTLDLPATPTTVTGAGAVIAPAPWPSDAIGQITVLRSMAAMTPVSIEEAVQRLVGAKRDIVHRHLETLAMLGEVRDIGGGRYAVAAGSV